MSWRILLLAIVLGSAGCAMFSKAREQNLRQFQVGDSEAEVIAAIGQPSEKSPLGSQERWYYEITSMDEKSTYPYTGVFENGKLVSWYFDTPRVGGRGTSQRGVASPPAH